MAGKKKTTKATRPRRARKRPPTPVPRRSRVARPATRKAPKKAAAKARRPASPKRRAQPRAAKRPVPASLVQRQRRLLPTAERFEAGESATESRMRAAARSGHDQLRSQIQRHTETSPVLTAGDVDAKWEDAYAAGDEAPGGDNPTPDQDRVDDIGKALGIEYDTDEELLGGDELTQRDEHRWELDPGSAEDWADKDNE